jgi:hypothetical protein
VEGDPPADPSKPRLPLWATLGLAALVIGVFFAIAFTTRGDEFLSGLLVCALPFALLVTFLAILATAGKGSRRLCGFCGYDRRGLSAQTPCPECGKPYDPNAPRYKAVGKRPIPAWIWVPALLPFPAMLLVRLAGNVQGYYMLGCLTALGVILLAGTIYSWNQGR